MVSKGQGHGGARDGAGRPSKYLTDSKTVPIKVPKKHKDNIQAITELIDLMLDEGFTFTEITEVLRKTLNKSV